MSNLFAVGWGETKQGLAPFHSPSGRVFLRNPVFNLYRGRKSGMNRRLFLLAGGALCTAGRRRSPRPSRRRGSASGSRLGARRDRSGLTSGREVATVSAIRLPLPSDRSRASPAIPPGNREIPWSALAARSSATSSTAASIAPHHRPFDGRHAGDDHRFARPAVAGRIMVVDMLPQPVGLFGGRSSEWGRSPTASAASSACAGRPPTSSPASSPPSSPPNAGNRRSDPDVTARAMHELAATDMGPELPRIRCSPWSTAR